MSFDSVKCDFCHSSIISTAFLFRCKDSGNFMQMHRVCLNKHRDAMLLDSMINDLKYIDIFERKVNVIEFQTPPGPHSSPEKIRNVWEERSLLKDKNVKRKLDI